MNEIYKDIKGYEGKYQVSNYGNVKSLINRYESKGVFIMNQYESNKGYKYLDLSQPRKRVLVHRLVAEAFVENLENLPIVNHLDNNPLNNHYSNLEWCTQSHNMKHAQNQDRLFEAQSKGGISRAKDARSESTQAAKDFVGKTFNKWTIVSYDTLKATGPNTFKDYVNVKCTCGKTASLYYNDIIKGNTKSCLLCQKKELSKTRLNDVLDEVKESTLGTWYITGNTTYSFGDTVRSVKFEVICTQCDTPSIIPYNSVIGIKPIKRCPICKNNEIKI